MKNVEFSLILACYNEGPTFSKSVKSILKHVNALRKSWEVIFVEDRSTDDTRAAVEQIVASEKNCKAIYHAKNKGRGASVSDGIKAAGGRIVGFIDVDCEISPSYLALFMKEVENGADMVIGTRFYESSAKSLSRVIASKSYAFICKTILGLPFEDTEAGFKFFNRVKIIPVLKNTKDHGWFWDTEICARAFKAKLKIKQLPVLFVRRSDKKSTVNLFADSITYAKRLLAFSTEYKKS